MSSAEVSEPANQYDETTKTKPRASRSSEEIERDNLVSVCKLVVKELIDSSLSQGRKADNDSVPLQQFFVVMEHILRHGLRERKGLLSQKKELWGLLETVEGSSLDASEITTSVKELPNVRTPLGRVRAWLRLALMQKKLADYFAILLDQKEILTEYYESESVMMHDEAMVVAGLLLGVNVIDCNLCLKEEELDTQPATIDFSLYLKRGSSLLEEPEDDQHTADDKITEVLDQKSYLEELNRHLQATVLDLQQKVSSLSTTNTLLREDVERGKSSVIKLEAECTELRKERDYMVEEMGRKIQLGRADIEVERETYEVSRQGLESLYTDARTRMDEETTLRLDVEKELQTQIMMKTEMEMASKLMEKDIHEKQDTIVSLRKQMEDIKLLNKEMFGKLQNTEQTLQHKAELVVRLEQKTNQMSDSMRQLEERCKQWERDKAAAEETARRVGQQIEQKDERRSQLESELAAEREMRVSVQKSICEWKEMGDRLEGEVARLRIVEQEGRELRAQNQDLKYKIEELEETLAEIGEHLSESKLKADEVSEKMKESETYVWTSDKDKTECKLCEKPFTVKRRKHHCRKCGDIFCNTCSENTMQLASSSKPVRVCDTCHSQLQDTHANMSSSSSASSGNTG